MPLPHQTIVLRIGLAFLLGFLLGLEREAKGHQAGLRTHILVCLGACLFTLAGTFGMPLEQILPSSWRRKCFRAGARIDPAAVAKQSRPRCMRWFRKLGQPAHHIGNITLARILGASTLQQGHRQLSQKIKTQVMKPAMLREFKRARPELVIGNFARGLQERSV